ncbi:MAG: hypothetical protein ACRECN_07170 [Methylocella sp.]
MTARLEEAVATYREALQERTRDRVPLQWARTQNNLGNALATLSRGALIGQRRVLVIQSLDVIMRPSHVGPISFGGQDRAA